MLLDLLQILAPGRLLAAQSGEPDFIRLEGSHERLDFPQLAALRGILAVQHAKLRFLLSNRLLRNDVDNIQVSIAGRAIAEFTCLREMIAGFEKRGRNSRKSFSHQVKHDDVLGLEYR